MPSLRRRFHSGSADLSHAPPSSLGRVFISPFFPEYAASPQSHQQHPPMALSIRRVRPSYPYGGGSSFHSQWYLGRAVPGTEHLTLNCFTNVKLMLVLVFGIVHNKVVGLIQSWLTEPRQVLNLYEPNWDLTLTKGNWAFVVTSRLRKQD